MPKYMVVIFFLTTFYHLVGLFILIDLFGHGGRRKVPENLIPWWLIVIWPFVLLVKLAVGITEKLK